VVNGAGISRDFDVGTAEAIGAPTLGAAETGSMGASAVGDGVGRSIPGAVVAGAEVVTFCGDEDGGTLCSIEVDAVGTAEDTGALIVGAVVIGSTGASVVGDGVGPSISGAVVVDGDDDTTGVGDRVGLSIFGAVVGRGVIGSGVGSPVNSFVGAHVGEVVDTMGATDGRELVASGTIDSRGADIDGGAVDELGVIDGRELVAGATDPPGTDDDDVWNR
jgi:hypothetical protein